MIALSRRNPPRPSRPTPGSSAVPAGVRTASEWSWRLLTVIALAGVVIYLVVLFQDIVVPLLVALLVSALLQPTVASLIRHHWPKWLAITVCVLAFGAVLAALIALVVWQVRIGLPQLEHESVAAYNRARDALRQPPWNVTDREFAGYIALVFGGPIQAVIMLAGVLVVHLLEAHVMQPLLVGGAVKVHPLAVVVGVAAGTGIAGVPGALFAVPLIAVGNAMVSAMLRVAHGRPAADDPGPEPVEVAGATPGT
jgi:predicted PurR-regulated permease PerM